MTYIGAEYSQQDLLKELRKQVKDENVESFDQYSDLVDNLLEEKKSYGFFSDEEDMEQIKSDLEISWSEIRTK